MTETCAQLVARGHWAEDAALHRCRVPYGPRNTWSNVAYPLVGWLLVLAWPGASTWVMALAMTMLGVGSGVYHATKTLFGNSLDWVGMYTTMTLAGLHAWAPRAPLPALAFCLVFSLWMGLVFSFKPGMRFDWHMAALFLVAAVPSVLYGDRRVALGAVALFGVSYLAQRLDYERKGTGLWGHALWHVGAALAMGALYVSRGGA